MITPHRRHPELVSGSIVRRDQRYRRQTQTNGQIRPRQVLGLNQIYLPRPMPVLQLLLALDRRRHVLKKFKAHEPIHGIFRCELPALRLPMLPHPRQQVRRHADIERSVMPARKDVDARLFAHVTVINKNGRHPELVSGSIPRPATIGCVSQWILKQVQHDDVWKIDTKLRPAVTL